MDHSRTIANMKGTNAEFIEPTWEMLSSVLIPHPLKTPSNAIAILANVILLSPSSKQGSKPANLRTKPRPQEHRGRTVGKTEHTPRKNSRTAGKRDPNLIKNNRNRKKNPQQSTKVKNHPIPPREDWKPPSIYQS
ncbi:hypothetical protein LINPERHAP1_LOCUS36122 [Linum perenne]